MSVVTNMVNRGGENHATYKGHRCISKVTTMVNILVVFLYLPMWLIITQPIKDIGVFLK